MNWNNLFFIKKGIDMFNNLLNYYLYDAQTRINNRIEKINNERAILKASGDKRYKSLRSLKYTILFGN